MPLGHRVVGLAASHLACVAQHARVLGNHCRCCQHLLLSGGRIQEVLTGHGDGLRIS